MKTILSIVFSLFALQAFSQTEIKFDSLKQALPLKVIDFFNPTTEIFITGVPNGIRELKFRDSKNPGSVMPFLAKPTTTPGKFAFENPFYGELKFNLFDPATTKAEYKTSEGEMIKIGFRFKEIVRREAGGENLSPSSRLTGSMITDALTLAKLKGDDKAHFCDSLKIFYGIPADTNTRKNPFFWDCPLPSVQAAGATSGGLSKSVGNILSSVGGIDVTNIADGLARFFVKRTKQELNAAFFNRLKEVLEDPKYLDIKLVFPQTNNSLQALGDEVYNYEAYLGTLKESFEQDLRTLPPHLQSWLYEGTLKDHLENHKEVRASAFSALYFYDQLSNDVHPGQAIADFPLDTLIGLPHIKLKTESLIIAGAAKTFIEISKSLWSGDKGDRYWISSETLKEFYKNKEAQKYYLAMLFEKVDTVKVLESGKTMGAFLTEWAPKFDTQVKPKLDQFKFFIQQTQQLEQKLKLVKNEAISDSARTERYFVFFEQFTATLKSGYQLTQNWLSIPVEEKTKFENILMLADQVSKLGLNVSRRKYGSAVIHAIGIYNFLSQKTTNTETLSDNKNVKLKENANSVVSEFLRYGSMIAAVAEARNSQEVADAIEAFALPAGSSGIKRKSAFNVALNGYTGVLAGHETGNKSPYINSYAVWAPVGISVSAGRISFGNWKNHSFSLFASFIDIGAVTAFRFSDDTTVAVPKIQLKDIISPGAAISWGIAKTPLSLAFGWQSAPFLRTVKAEENATLNYRASRWHVTLAVDIPLLNFYNSKNWKK